MCRYSFCSHTVLYVVIFVSDMYFPVIPQLDVEIILQISHLILQCMGELVNGTTSNLFSGGYTCYSYTV